MREFIARANIDHFRQLIAEERDPGERDRLERMLADELATLQQYRTHPDDGPVWPRDAASASQLIEARRHEGVWGAEVAEPIRARRSVTAWLLALYRMAGQGRTPRPVHHDEACARDHLQSARTRLRDT